MKKIMLMIGCLVIMMAGKTQTKAANNHLPIQLITFFQGPWKGEGSFASGRRIAAEVVFKVSLDSCWLVCDHADLPPNSYKAMLVWGIDKGTGKFLAYNFDNFHGHRQFESDGWSDGRLLLYSKQSDTRYERFAYEKQSSTSFKMTYQTSQDSNTWKIVDSLTFQKELK